MSRTSTIRPGIYQSDGKPLSKAAIYQNNLKTGLYINPNSPSTGLPSNYKGTSAAVKAVNTDLSVPVYRRDLSSEAASAALNAKSDSSPVAWKREKVDSGAENAALKARNQSQKTTSLANSIKPFSSKSLNSSSIFANSAAKSLSSKDACSFAGERLPDLYTLDSPRTSNHKSNNKNFNINKLHEKANKNANDNIKERLSPSKINHRIGVPSTKANSIVSSQYSSAGALKSTRSNTITSDLQNSNNSSNHAKISQMDLKVLEQAKLIANQKLKQIDEQNGKTYLLGNPEFNAHAMKIAQQKANERYQKNTQLEGKINVGLGKYVNAVDVNNLARSNIAPVIEDINAAVAEQRRIDFEYEEEQRLIAEEQQRLKNENYQNALLSKRQKKEEKLEKKRNIQAQKHENKHLKEDLINENEAELRQKEQHLAQLKAQESQLQQEIEKEKSDILEKYRKEENDLILKTKNQISILKREKQLEISEDSEHAEHAEHAENVEIAHKTDVEPNTNISKPKDNSSPTTDKPPGMFLESW
ncbi:uncharacterized protein ASCRUDRAFT_68925 [Ascoidea rubescens DSM 1968]|uniref:Eisosome protein 1 n=1 Tax=Ascoidea rubescens DSM 1968 TaxID=1344418 RepID=A0A1D2VNG9_9ASCO|nr:hypothetical protein ASCRUDRAFT_68925 [Ascoidea rubescens DSM 1968]ODV63158.1 hypothetical protein ASCRUDRAFT_68925 [Ascoidea rubescens DSM 1968]